MLPAGLIITPTSNKALAICRLCSTLSVGQILSRRPRRSVSAELEAHGGADAFLPSCGPCASGSVRKARH